VSEPTDAARQARPWPPADPTALDRAAWFSLRTTVVVVGAWVLLLAFDVLRVVVVPVAVAVLLAAALHPVARRLAPTLGRTGGALATVGGAVLLLGATVAGATWMVLGSARDELVPAIEDARDRAERWLEEGPLGIERAQVESAVSSAGDALVRDGSLAGGVVSAGQVVVGLLLALVLTIFAVRDLDLGIDAIARRRADGPRWREAIEAGLHRLRRYLLAVVVLGTVEGIVIGGTVALVASPGLGVGVGGLTFVAAFFPIVGAVAAGAVAVAAVLAVEGVTAALLTLAVAVVVQQFDNDLLAPILYGRALALHPAFVLVVLTAGGALAGLAGAALAVPVASAVLAARTSWRRTSLASDDDGDPVDRRLARAVPGHG
jgi:predicted PurR-regulated permease PerM